MLVIPIFGMDIPEANRFLTSKEENNTRAIQTYIFFAKEGMINTSSLEYLGGFLSVVFEDQGKDVDDMLKMLSEQNLSSIEAKPIAIGLFGANIDSVKEKMDKYFPNVGDSNIDIFSNYQEKQFKIKRSKDIEFIWGRYLKNRDIKELYSICEHSNFKDMSMISGQANSTLIQYGFLYDYVYKDLLKIQNDKNFKNKKNIKIVLDKINDLKDDQKYDNVSF